jgi:DNA-binding FadR family transcriptional regulator
MSAGRCRHTLAARLSFENNRRGMTSGIDPVLPPIERVLADHRDRRTAAADIASRVGVSIDLGLLQPLERLPRDDELATAFGVAPITVRRALRQLCGEGILVRRRGRGGGTFVASHPPRSQLRRYEVERARLSRQIWDLLDYRLVLESGLAQLAARTASSDEIAVLQELVEEMDAAPDWASFRLLDHSFHLAIAGTAASPRARDELASLLDKIGRLYFPYPLEYLRESNREHRAIANAIAGRDVIGALEAVATHVRAAKESFAWIRETALPPPLDTNESS